ncbi:MAG: transcriptional repressor LexA [Clostridia bacterium]
MSAHKEQRSNKYTDLTCRQEQVFDYICKYLKQHPYPPTVREIQKQLRIKSTSTVQYALDGLEKAGYIFRSGKKMRAIEIREKESSYSDNVILTPIVGSIAAGEPIFADQNISEYVPLPSGVYSTTNKLFILEVRGDSMINAGILNGDYVIIEQGEAAENGEIIAALIDDSATVKRYFKEENHIRLQPENDTMKPIIITGELRILGKVVGLFRNQIH